MFGLRPEIIVQMSESWRGLPKVERLLRHGLTQLLHQRHPSISPREMVVR